MQGHEETRNVDPAGILAAALDAVIVIDAAGIVQEWNPAAEAMFDQPRAGAVGKELATLVIPERYREAHRRALRRYVETREPTILDRRLDLTALRRDGAEFHVELTVTAVPGAEPPVFAGFVRDLSERDLAERESVRMQERMHFLASAGLALDVSLDLEETLRRLAAMTVPQLAELAVIDLLTSDGSIRGGVAAAGTDPATAEAVEAMRSRYPLEAGGPHPVAHVLRTGEGLLLPEMSDDELERYARSPEHYELMQRLRYSSAIVVPLPARRRLLGTLSLLRLGDQTPFDEHDLLLAETLGRRAGLALENARLYESTRHIARTLQESLLPRRLPEIPNVRLVGRYRAAAEGQDVGGDFYDAFEIGDERWGIAMGDVCGKGPEAAALTALARYTIRAIAGHNAPAVLALLNDAVRRSHEGNERFLSAVFAELVGGGDELVLDVAVAGHPPPFVLRSNGDAEMLETRGPLLGVMAEPVFASERVTLAPGDRLVLYTDGLTDARAPDRVLLEPDLAALLRAGSNLDAYELATFLENEATAGAEPRDDIALVVVEALGTIATAAAAATDAGRSDAD